MHTWKSSHLPKIIQIVLNLLQYVAVYFGTNVRLGRPDSTASYTGMFQLRAKNHVDPFCSDERQR